MAKSSRRLINTYLLITALVLVVGSTAVASFYLRVAEANPRGGLDVSGAVGVGSAILLYWLFRGWLLPAGQAARGGARGARRDGDGAGDERPEVAAEIERELARAREIAAADASIPEMGVRSRRASSRSSRSWRAGRWRSWRSARSTAGRAR
jgi:hypothetical protein